MSIFYFYQDVSKHFLLLFPFLSSASLFNWFNWFDWIECSSHFVIISFLIFKLINGTPLSLFILFFLLNFLLGWINLCNLNYLCCSIFFLFFAFLSIFAPIMCVRLWMWLRAYFSSVLWEFVLLNTIKLHHMCLLIMRICNNETLLKCRLLNLLYYKNKLVNVCYSKILLTTKN